MLRKAPMIQWVVRLNRPSQYDQQLCSIASRGHRMQSIPRRRRASFPHRTAVIAVGEYLRR
jgi:hypothetical protein